MSSNLDSGKFTTRAQAEAGKGDQSSQSNAFVRTDPDKQRNDTSQTGQDSSISSDPSAQAGARRSSAYAFVHDQLSHPDEVSRPEE